MVFLSKTKMKCHSLDGIRRRLSYNHGFNVPPVRVAGGGLSLSWHESTEMQVLFATKNIIHSTMRDSKGGEWIHASWIYGTSYRARKEISGASCRLC